MTNIFATRTVARNVEDDIAIIAQQSSKPKVGEFKVNYATTNVPIESIDVRNQKGYKNLTLSVDEFQQSGKRLRIDSLNSDGTVANSVFVGEKALGAFIEASQLLMDYNLDD